MLAKVRQGEIVETVYREGKASISELAERFNVTTETIRRDLVILTNNEKLQRVHGGVVLASAVRSEPDYEYRIKLHAEEKRRIGQAAAKLIKDGDAIFIDEGSASTALAEALTGLRGLQIVTCSLPNAVLLAKKLKDGEITGNLTVLGGIVDPQSKGVFGLEAAQQLLKMNFSLAFFGATALNSDGIYVWYASEANFTRNLLEKSMKRVCLAESEKFGKTSFCHVTGFENVDILFTDSKNPIDNEILKAIHEAGTEVQIIQA
ncbi:MAG: DeoR/GlpR family DNA-binding transcription regulator [Clostridia bacterium]|nr:DeoR/GlpR family DNA-binding transcription regulator [Clostridia bacterium]